jgi:hypothetical protein
MDKRYKLTIILMPTVKQALSDDNKEIPFAKSAAAAG